MSTERLQKFLARSGVASRRNSEELIRLGRVKLNGRVVTELGTKVDPDKDVVTLDGKEIHPPSTKIYYLLHKPAGYITTVSDEFGRPTVLHLLAQTSERLFPVGRLDADTEGLLLITNDGDFALRLTHPRFALEKEYLAEVQGHPSRETISRLQKGIILDSKKTAPANVQITEIKSRAVNKVQTTWLRMTIHEGRKRQIRRMCESVGHPVIRLIRVRVGPLRIGELPVSTYRELTPAELKSFERLWST